MEESLSIIANEIYNLAQPRAYDWLVLVIALVSILVTCAVAIYTYLIYKRQLALMEEQSKISMVQTDIAVKQTEIMQYQNKIALFEKRYEVYAKLVQISRIKHLEKLIKAPVPGVDIIGIQKSFIITDVFKIVPSDNKSKPEDTLLKAMQKVNPYKTDIERARFLFEDTLAENAVAFADVVITAMGDCLIGIKQIDSSIFDTIHKFEKTTLLEIEKSLQL